MKQLVFILLLSASLQAQSVVTPSSAVITTEIALSGGGTVCTGTITILPSPGFRQCWYYRNGRFTDERIYNSYTEGGNPLCFLHLFVGEGRVTMWLQNYTLPDARFVKIADLFSSFDSTLMARVTGFEILDNGHEKPYTISIYQSSENDPSVWPVGETIRSIDDVRVKILRAIKLSRK